MTSRSKKLKSVFLVAALLLLTIGVFMFSRHEDRQTVTSERQQESSGKPHNKPDEQPDEPAFDKKKYSTDRAASIWVVANKSRPLSPINYAPNDLVDVGNGQFLRQEAAAALQEMVTAASTQRLSIQPLSGYRSYQTQQVVYSREVATYGQAVADTQSAKPGHSEHQTGLSMDVGGGGCGIEDCFGSTAEGKWVAANAHTYGFIIRYPEGKQSVTGYRYEPWHVRYVGKELAAEMKRTNTSTLEEFFNL